jgi:hypothetical protein
MTLFERETNVVINNNTLWNVTPRSLVGGYQRFGRTCCIDLIT